MKSFRIQTVALGGHQPQRTHSRRELLGVKATTFLTLCLWVGKHLAFSIVVVWRSRAKNLLGGAFSGGPIASRHSAIFSSLRSPSTISGVSFVRLSMEVSRRPLAERRVRPVCSPQKRSR